MVEDSYKLLCFDGFIPHLSSHKLMYTAKSLHRSPDSWTRPWYGDKKYSYAHM